MPGPSIIDRLRQGLNSMRGRNTFEDQDPTNMFPYELGPSYSVSPTRPRFRLGNEKSIIASLYTRIAIDVSAIAIQHVRLDQNGRYLNTMDTGLNERLTVQANIDQTGRSFIQDVVVSLLEEGCVAIVPVDTMSNPSMSGVGDILSMRTGKINQWYPYHVSLNVYNERKGIKEDIILPKRDVAIIENPLYSVMNEPSSILKRLVTKLNQLDAIDEQAASGKLDLIIQLPYVVKTEARAAQAEKRRKDIETQLSGSKYGIAYTDGTEKVTQLNRSAENNMMKAIEYLTSMLYSQLGISQAIFDGTADEKTMINYHNRTIEPVLSAIADSMTCKFLTKTGRSQGQAIAYFRNPFGLVPASEFATISDVFSRNTILSANEIRAVIGYKPSSDPNADKLVNKNMPPTNGTSPEQIANENSVENSDQTSLADKLFSDVSAARNSKK